jgi:4-amino-4-deoxychorismate lyase
MIYFDGAQFTSGRIGLNVDGPAFRYGFSFFETMLWNGSAVCRFGEHMRRLWSSLGAFGVPYEVSDCRVLIQEVVSRNGLEEHYARVNVVYPVDASPSAPASGPARPVVCAAPYTPPAPGASRTLGVCPRPLHSWLGAHKCGNYLPYLLARRAAVHEGLDDAVLCSPDGNVLEAATAALVLRAGNKYITPVPVDCGQRTAGVLPSIALAAAREELVITPQPVALAELGGFESAYVLNSLIGMVPVAAIGDVLFDENAAPCAKVRAAVWRADASGPVGEGNSSAISD